MAGLDKWARSLDGEVGSDEARVLAQHHSSMNRWRVVSSSISSQSLACVAAISSVVKSRKSSSGSSKMGGVAVVVPHQLVMDIGVTVAQALPDRCNINLRVIAFRVSGTLVVEATSSLTNSFL